MSTMTLETPEVLAMLIMPSPPTADTVNAALVVPAARLSEDVLGRAWPDGQTVRYVALLGQVAVTLTATALTPVCGTPATPVTRRSRRPPGPRGRLLPSRLSCSRAGWTAM